MSAEGVTWTYHPGYWREQEILIQEMREMVNEWCREEERREEDGTFTPQKRHVLFKRREQARVQAAILHVMRDQIFAATVDEIIWALVNEKGGGLWLPSVADGVTGYTGEFQRLLRLNYPLGSVERLELVEGPSWMQSRYKHHGFEPWHQF